MFAPSAFNMQSTRLMVLDGSNHQKIWDIVDETLTEKIGEDKMVATRERLQGFRNGNGTILFFEDDNIVKEHAKKSKTYEALFPNWSEQGNGIFQYAVWLLLTNERLAASGQHYNPIIDEKVHKFFETPSFWRLIAQMPFGLADEELLERKFIPFDTDTMVKFK